MYNNGALPLATSGLGTMAFAGDHIWVGLAAFALAATGSAIMRIIPRKEDQRVEL